MLAKIGEAVVFCPRGALVGCAFNNKSTINADNPGCRTQGVKDFALIYKLCNSF
jgi:hypothetical protein